MTWPVFSVSQLTEMGVLRVEDGNHGEYRPRPHEFAATGTAFIRAADLANGRVQFDLAERISESARARIRKGIGQPRDVLLSHKGTVGKVALVQHGAPPFVCSPQTTFWRSMNHDRLLPEFLFSYLRSAAFQEQLARVAGSTDMAPYVSLTQQRDLKLEVPPSLAQRAVAEILGALDDKIAANGRVSAMAVRLADSEFQSAKNRHALTITAFDAVCTAAGGGTPSTKVAEFWDGDIPWVTPTDVTALSSPYLDHTARRITDTGLAKCSSALYPVDSILMTSRATIGAFALAKTPVAVNQGFIVAEARDREAQLWLFHEMRSRVDDFLAHANGATFLELNKARFRGIEVLWPDDPGTYKQFSRRVTHLHDRAYAATLESRALVSLRDTLLPHLVSGRISVREAEKAVEEVL